MITAEEFPCGCILEGKENLYENRLLAEKEDFYQTYREKRLYIKMKGLTNRC